MNINQIKGIQRRVGTIDDGKWGSKSDAACESHLRRKMPVPNPWPDSDPASLRAFYGNPGDESKLVNLNVEGLGVKYEGGLVKTIRCHNRVAESLHRIISRLSDIFPEILAQYAGCYNNRSMRGSSTPSLHAFAAAIDFDPGSNGNHTHWPTGATMPLGVMEIFAAEGWLPAGAFWNRDAMHFQATK